MGSDMKKSLFTLVVFLAVTICYGQTLAPDAQVIANDIGIEEISLIQLRSALRGELSQWPSKQPVTVILHSTSMNECALTSSFVVNSPRPAVLQKFWMGLVFGGRATPPVFAKSQAELIEAIRSTPGSVGLIYGSKAPKELVILLKD